MRKQNKIVLWPVYFDSTKTRGEGRKIPKKLAVSSPKISELKEAAEKLGLEHELVLDACYPKMPWLNTGLLLVTKKGTKNNIIKEIARQLLKIRAASKTA
ncbi:MAG: signal recognition particle subunit SRP19/SEC65 family protein [Nitrososphaerota archaeon]|nr:signal recognition particle protein Srp19 [Candidatus Bathyarchaeota archaeon]MDW8023589.1 signal recognition particle subunit SRP19/SEC65 family protein [Nitrososphaerota archaeon]